MITMDDNNNWDYNASDYWNDVIANLDGTYEEYKSWRDILSKDNYEKEFEKKTGINTITEYLMEFDDVVEWLEYLHEMALDLEDYEFCAVLLNRRLWAHWKNTAINEELEKVYAN